MKTIAFLIDNFGVILALGFIITMGVMAVVELVGTWSDKAEGAITERHLELHANIIIQSVLALTVVSYAIYTISLTPIPYMLNEGATANQAFVDGVLDLSKVHHNHTDTFLSALGSTEGVLMCFGIFVFIYVAIHHLHEERMAENQEELYN